MDLIYGLTYGLTTAIVCAHRVQAIVTSRVIAEEGLAELDVGDSCFFSGSSIQDIIRSTIDHIRPRAGQIGREVVQHAEIARCERRGDNNVLPDNKRRQITSWLTGYRPLLTERPQ